MNKSSTLKIFLSILFLFVVAIVYAESLDEDQARNAAMEFFSSSSQGARLHTQGSQLVLRSKNSDAGYYIFDRPEGGFVFVADDDAIGRAVLGYTDEGSYSVENLPTGFREWLDQVSVLMSAVHEGKICRERLPNRARQIVVNSLIQTKWNQRAPYNNLCPTMLYGGKCITGCVATAMAQIMKYWEWPKHGYGSVSYYDEYGCGRTLSQDFSLNYYNWDDMLNTYSSGYTSIQATAVATLMRDCGYAVQMKYTPEASSAYLSPKTMSQYFHYSAGAKERYCYDYPEELWHEFIRQDLNAKRPVLYSGNGDTGGHMFILDGFDTDGYYHVNWGWGGYADGWFMLTNLNDYNNDQGMINNLEPEYEDDNFSYTLSSDGVLTINGTGVMPQKYELDEAPWAGDCSKIHKIVIGEGVTGIIDYFGYGYQSGNRFSNLEELVLPEGLLSIGKAAFEYSGLTSVLLPSTLISMDNAFWGSELMSLHLPRMLLGYTDYLPTLKELTVDETSPWLSVEDNILYTKDCRSLLFIPGGLSRITIAESTEDIYDENLFRYGIPIISKCKDAPSLPQYVLNYPNYYVDDCGYLFIPYVSTGYNTWKTILSAGWTILNYVDIEYIPEININWTLNGSTLSISGWGGQNTEEYGYTAAPYYQNRRNIEKLVVCDGVKSLCWAAFFGYSLEDVELPSTLSSIGSQCFGYTGLTSITCKARTAPSLGSNVFLGLPFSGRLRVPEGSDYSAWLMVLPSGWSIEYFAPEALATCYLYTGEQQQVQDLEEWEKLLKQYPNTISIVNPGKEEWAYMTRNMLVENVSAEGGYLCPYFQLIDLTNGFGSTTNAPKTGFSAPVPFSIAKGEYKRNLSLGYNTLCLPFVVNKEDFSKDCQMYEYSHFDSNKGDVIFVSQTKAEPGHAFFVKTNADFVWQTNLSGKTVTILQASASDEKTRGTFVITDAFQGTGYSPRLKDNIFAPLDRYLYPFRACIFINASDAPSEVRVQEMDIDEADGINCITGSPAKSCCKIYTLDGKLISSPVMGHPYIENGKIIVR